MHINSGTILKLKTEQFEVLYFKIISVMVTAYCVKEICTFTKGKIKPRVITESCVSEQSGVSHTLLI